MPWSRPPSTHFMPAPLMQSSPGSTLWILVAVSAAPSSLFCRHLSSLQALTTVSIPLLKGLPKLGDSSTSFLEAALKSFTQHTPSCYPVPAHLKSKHPHVAITTTLRCLHIFNFMTSKSHAIHSCSSVLYFPCQ